ncbi:hypothetical protein HAX54_010570, partial [Datura stramonium]|nr:hypothetical protein [Datura stramonium]
LRPPFTKASVAGSPIIRSSTSLTFRHWAGVNPHTWSYDFAETCVFGKQSPDLSNSNIGENPMPQKPKGSSAMFIHGGVRRGRENASSQCSNTRHYDLQENMIEINPKGANKEGLEHWSNVG